MNLTPLAANMTELDLHCNKILFSYKTPVAVVWVNDNGGYYVYRTEKKWSNTTTRHINTWIASLPFVFVDAVTTKPQEYFDNLIREVK